MMDREDAGTIVRPAWVVEREAKAQKKRSKPRTVDSRGNRIVTVEKCTETVGATAKANESKNQEIARLEKAIADLKAGKKVKVVVPRTVRTHKPREVELLTPGNREAKKAAEIADLEKRIAKLGGI